MSGSAIEINSSRSKLVKIPLSVGVFGNIPSTAPITNTILGLSGRIVSAFPRVTSSRVLGIVDIFPCEIIISISSKYLFGDIYFSFKVS